MASAEPAGTAGAGSSPTRGKIEKKPPQEISPRFSAGRDGWTHDSTQQQYTYYYTVVDLSIVHVAKATKDPTPTGTVQLHPGVRFPVLYRSATRVGILTFCSSGRGVCGGFLLVLDL